MYDELILKSHETQNKKPHPLPHPFRPYPRQIAFGIANLGLPTDDYNTNLSSTILDLMQFKGELNEQLFLRYVEMQQRAATIDLSTGNFKMQALAGTIYEALRSYT